VNAQTRLMIEGDMHEVVSFLVETTF